MFLKKTLSLPDTNRAGFFMRAADYWRGAYRRMEVVHHEVQTSKFAAGDTLRVAILSDIHADPRFMPLPRVAEAVALTNAQKPDLIYMGGDLLAQDNWTMTPEPLEDVVSVLGGLSAPLGVFATPGNHDWWDDPATQQGESDTPRSVPLLEAAGLQVLRNRAVKLDCAADVWVAGIDSQWAYEGEKRCVHTGADDLDAALRDVPQGAYGLLLAHEPDIFAHLPERDVSGAVDMVLSGHTHGGQITVFQSRPIIPSRYGRRYAYGHCTEVGRDLVVSGGLGCSVLPLRFGVVPEITMVTLRGAP